MQVMKAQGLPFVGFSTRATQNHARRCRDKGLIGQKDFELASKPVYSDQNFTIAPLLVWYDSTHIATVKFYNEWVFGPDHQWVKGGFIEDELGQEQRAALKEEGFACHSRYQLYFCCDDHEDPFIKHLDGSTFLTID
jgi:hypothetical protein